jgi:hypothetical protein
MATRMQQRRGTAAQWTSANPILAAGEIGFETDTGKFKMGNGSSAWSALSYFADSSDFDTTAIESTIDTKVAAAVNTLVAGAPAALDTLNELAAAIDDNGSYASTVTASLASKLSLGGGTMTGDIIMSNNKIMDLAQPVSNSDAANKIYVDNAKTGAETFATNSISVVATDLDTHKSNTLNVHGIIDTAALATKTYADNKVEAEINTHNSASLSVHGISNTADLATKTYADNAVSTHNSDETNVHGISNTADLATKTYADSAVSTHNGVSTNVHGIADTANLVTLAGTQTLTNKTITSPSGLVKADVGLANVDNTSDADKPISTAAQTALDLKAPLASPTFTGTVTTPLSTAGYVKTDASGVLSSSAAVAQGDVTGLTSDLALKAPLASPALTGTPTAPTATAGTNTTQVATTEFVTGAVADLIASAPGALNTLDELAAALGDDANFATTVTNSLAAKAPLASPTFTGTVTLPAAGIVFSDGTQSKAGVPSITTFATAIASSATLSAGEQDKFVPLTGAVTITLPATGYSTGQSIDFYQASGTGAQFASTNSVVGTPGLKFRTTNSVATALKTSSGWLVFGDLSA